MSKFLETNGFIGMIGEVDVKKDLVKSLEKIKHRAWKQITIINNKEILNIKDYLEEPNSRIAIGCCITSNNEQHTKNNIAIHGKIYSHKNSELTNKIINSINSDKLKELGYILKEIDSDYNIIAINNKELIVARDPLGTKPLYLGKSNKITAVATEKKALEVIGIEIIQEIYPGSIYRIKHNSIKYNKFREINKSIISKTDKHTSKIIDILNESIKKRLNGMKKIGVGFSGGLDSSLLAYLASKYVEVKLISVHKKNSRDERITDKAASKLDLEIEHITIDEEYIRKTLPTIEYLIEDNQLMNLSIATIMFLSAKKVSELKLEGLFVGQLADELFGGYVKYLHSMENGKEHVNKMLYNDIRYAYKNNFPRDEKSVSPFSYLFMPYSSINLVDYSIGIPLEFKINQNELIRKKILREAAIISGMDKYIANEPKKAAQYSSGTQNIIRKIIKSNETNKYN